MDKKELRDFVKQGLSLQRIADKVGKSKTTVRYWLKKHGLKPAYSQHGGGWHKKPVRPCNLCDTLTGRGHLCAACWAKVRRYRLKLAVVKYLGGVCVECGWTGHVAGFVCHHSKGPKEFQISRKTSWSWESIKKELDKCVLMCGSCHLIEHAFAQSVIDEALNYDGLYPV